MPNKRSTQNRHTQAVIIIHGIGEQRPMATLRSFVDAVLPKPEEGGEKYFSKPDMLSNSYELRKLQNRSQPRTHFFEYYWAYQVEGTKFEHIRAWLKTLLWRKPGSVPRQLMLLWLISWILIVIALTAAVLGIGTITDQLTALFPRVASLMNRYAAFSPWLVSALSAALLGMINYFVFQYVGDVARYLTPLPSNIKLRQAIRAQGVDLLKRIHEQGEYERVIVVGHSLGSIIAYDILKLLWEEYKEEYKLPRISQQEALAHLEEVGDCLQQGVPGITVSHYQEAQVNLWKEMRSLGNPWLVTDLITLGSPLAHAALVLASDETDLKARQRQRELPTDPPVEEIEKVHGQDRRCYSYRVWDGYGEERDIKLRAVHHGGHFAFTRWTNFYFPGDLAGGPITVFGPGVRNIPVATGNSFIDRTIRSHTNYWNKAVIKQDAKSSSVSELVKALDLQNRAYFTDEQD
jgi:hypothetical protein